MYQVNCDNATIGTRLVFTPFKRYNQTKILRLLYNQTLDRGANVLVYASGAISGCRMKSGVLTVSGGGEVHRLVVENGSLSWIEVLSKTLSFITEPLLKCMLAELLNASDSSAM